jgi:chitin disaccharide deacetylase
MNIIINADDFGATKELNSCVKELHEMGVLSSATIISNSEAFDDAVDLAKRLPGLGVGVHLTLDGPFNILKNPSSVINPNSLQFYNSHEALSKLRFYSFKREDIFNEYCAQIEKVLNAGIKITHLDHHHHLHLYFRSLGQVKRAARKYGIKFIRSQILLNPWHKSYVNSVYRKLHQYYIRERDIHVTDGYFEFIKSSPDPRSLNLSRLEQVLAEKIRTFEIETHPNDQNCFDTIFLKDQDVRSLLKKHRIINYRDMLS